jgi:DNA-3-methyladenine glycosylase
LTPFKRSFFNRPATEVACELLGAQLTRVVDGHCMCGVISEAEAYLGEDDLGCHAHAGKTRRNAVMYGPPGFAYVYFTYGMHWMLNAVTGAEDSPAAVLIRAIRPLVGQDWMAANRPHLVGKPHWLDGPAKLTQALAIDGTLNGIDLCNPDSGLFLSAGTAIARQHILTTPRIGLNSVPEPWKSIPWRFMVKAEDPALDDENSK